MEEKWKDISGTNGYYQVSNNGSVRSWNNKGNNRKIEAQNIKAISGRKKIKPDLVSTNL